jgi:hypothetical protein
MFDSELALGLLKSRLGIKVNTLDEYLIQVVTAAHDKLVNQMGIVFDETQLDHVMMLTDYAAWRYQNRDTVGEMPQWLRLELRELYLSSHAKEVSDAGI